MGLSSHFFENTVLLWPLAYWGQLPGPLCRAAVALEVGRSPQEASETVDAQGGGGSEEGGKGSVRDGEGLSLVRCLQEASGFL